MKSIQREFMIIAVIALIGCSQDSSTIKLENDKQCRPLQVKIGTDLIVSLKGNVSTGYRWLMVSQPHFLSLIQEKSITKNNKGNQLGRPDVTTWQYKVHSEGVGNLRFTYQKPWESGRKYFDCKIVSE